MNSYEYRHALRYASELTKLWLLDLFKKKYPSVFHHTDIETRPATETDYFVPPSLRNRCIVVNKLVFNETGCVKLSCFPFKENLEPCDSTDDVRWLRIGYGFTLACQPACQHLVNLDVEYENGKCIGVNTQKKLFAMIPEKLYGMTSKQKLHKGLDIVDGHLRINDIYCIAYGLSFDSEKHECYTSSGQAFGEMILGSSIYRKLFTERDYTKKLPNFPPIPQNLNRMDRITRHDNSTSHNSSGSNDSNDSVSLVNDIVVSLAVNYGIDISLSTIHRFLKRSSPKVIMKALQSSSLKSALIHILAKSYTVTYNISKTLLKGISTANTALNAVGVVVGIVDLFDPFEYNRILGKTDVDRIDRKLDAVFYRSINTREEVTPEIVWELYMDEDTMNDRIQFMTDCVEEYLDALNSTSQNLPYIDERQFENKKETEVIRNFTFHVFTLLLGALLIASTLFLYHLHIWCVLIFTITAVYFLTK